MCIFIITKLLKTEISNNYLQQDKYKTFHETHFKSGTEKPSVDR